MSHIGCEIEGIAGSGEVEGYLAQVPEPQVLFHYGSHETRMPLDRGIRQLLKQGFIPMELARTGIMNALAHQQSHDNLDPSDAYDTANILEYILYQIEEQAQAPIPGRVTNSHRKPKNKVY